MKLVAALKFSTTEGGNNPRHREIGQTGSGRREAFLMLIPINSCVNWRVSRIRSAFIRGQWGIIALQSGPYPPLESADELFQRTNYNSVCSDAEPRYGSCED